MDVRSFSAILTVIYVTIQVVIAFFVSIFGAILVHQCTQQPSTPNPQSTPKIEDTAYDEQKKSGTNQASIAISVCVEEETSQTSNAKQKDFCQLWLKTVWKMRSVYGGLAVHSFDVLTDVLVIFQWINAENIEGDNVDPQIMAYSAIAVLLFSRITSACAIYIKEGHLLRSILQLFDLLIFQEIYESHHKIISQFKNNQLKDKNHPIESTLSFKYVRNMEAIFESIPESVLQLVYVMRTGTSQFQSDQIIFIVSIVQSLISMTNSVLNNDYTLMQESKWNKYKKRFPPSFEFFKHALCRVSEIAHRIGLLALFWTVCGGQAFAILLGIEAFLIALRQSMLIYGGEQIFDADTILLAMSSVIVVPSEEIYGIADMDWHIMWGSEMKGSEPLEIAMICCALLFANLCCCVSCTSLIISLSFLWDEDGPDMSWPPLARIGLSLNEIIFIMIWAFVGENGSRKPFLLDVEHGLVIFIVTCVCFLVFSQYRILFPNFSLPFSVNVRSKWGYAYSNELSELKKIRVPLKKIPYKIVRKVRDEDKKVVFEINSEGDFWDEPYRYVKDNAFSAALFALAKGNHEIVQWLEARGAVAHKNVDLTYIVGLIADDLNESE